MDIDFDYDDRKGRALWDWDAADSDHNISLCIPLAITFSAAEPEQDAPGVTDDDITIESVRVSMDGQWRGVEHLLEREFKDNLPSYTFRDEIADWINDHRPVLEDWEHQESERQAEYGERGVA